MSKTYKDRPDNRPKNGRGGRARQRHISVRAVLRERPDVQRLSRAVISLALSQAETEAQASGEQPAQADAAQPDQESADDGG